MALKTLENYLNGVRHYMRHLRHDSLSSRRAVSIPFKCRESKSTPVFLAIRWRKAVRSGFA
ncbi:hypothetical protein BDV35DRAFT_374621 [Aspergillus flavus]|uniref:Uncharacterized protein n=1 Tax=Aspergillus flavus TaxID=5059 RepID=A0A5N6GCJ5_ASPFL|nr:hypothetical protein BDV35DRAFT_374621 [Aspergillus flavus]